jgi:hypothetical protein
LLAFVAIAALGWPLARLTASRPAPVVVEPAPVAAQNVHLALAFTAPPSRVAVLHLGKEIWAADLNASDVETDLALPWPEEGVDLRFLVAWPDDAPLAAARIVITGPDGEDRERSIWSRGPADAVLTFR